MLLILKSFLFQCAIGASAEELPKPYQCLKFLSIGIRLNNFEEILAALCFLRSSPALQELKISVSFTLLKHAINILMLIFKCQYSLI